MMYGGKTIGVVVPAYNETEFVADVIETVPGFVDRIYVVDDCSTDDTWTAILDALTKPADASQSRSAAVTDGGPGTTEIGRVQTGTVASPGEGSSAGSAAFDERVVAIRHAVNAGVGGAIKTGYRHALDDGIDVTAVMSGDGQMDPAILDRIIDPVVYDDAEYAKGNRLRYPKYRRQMSGWRTFGNYLLTYLTRIASGYWRMMDPQNGYTAISKTALEAIDMDTLYDDYGFSNDVLVRLNTHGLRIADVPMRAVYGDETSYIRYSRFVPALSLLLLQSYLRRIVHRTVRKESSTTVTLQLVGILCLLLGTVAMGSTLAGVGPSAGLPGGGVLSLVGGGLFLVGVAADRHRGARLVVSIDPPEPPQESGDGTRVPSPADDTPEEG